MEFMLGGIAACGAGFFTNPLEVVKTRMQLQGELKARGQYAMHYKNVFHASYTIAKNDGILALQRGLVPALWYQLLMNGLRLGVFQSINNSGFTKKANGSQSWIKTVIAGAGSGVIGAMFGSPIYMVKTQLQSRANTNIAVGHQYKHTSMTQGLVHTYKQYGLQGLYRGVSGAVPRVMVGSAAQLSTFSTSLEVVKNLNLFSPTGWMLPLVASMISGVVTVACMTPFDVVSTRLYNQPIDNQGRGLLYRNVGDCLMKVFRKEGLWGLYKGWGPSLFRLGPHTVLSLVFWNRIRKYYYDYAECRDRK